ncbi:phage tail tape measure protein [Streptomyces sp. NPDC096080]|uniref:phage tail tape measure protein n=1 Tax=Streptomyces sp. NPDC096080 TaxID=3156693 RepID=UPI00332BEB54
MALRVGELEAVITVDDRAVDPSLRRAEQAFRQTARNIGSDAQDAGDSAGRRLGEGLHDAGTAGADRAGESIGQRLRGHLKMAAAGVGAAAGAILMSAFGQAMDQGQVTARLGAQLGATPQVAQRYGQVAGALFKDAVVENFEAGADAVKAIASNGLLPPGATNAQIKSIATNAADLASTMGVDVSLAAQAASGMLKNGLAKDGKQAFDLLVRGSKGLGAAGEDLLETFSEYSPIFKSAGLSGQTAMGLIRQGVQGGWVKDTDKIADAFKELHVRVTDGSKASQDAMTALGLDAKKTMSDVAEGGATGEKAMGSVLAAIQKMGPKSAAAKQAISALFGGPGEDLGATLFKLNVGKAGKAMSGAQGAADRFGNALRDNAATKLTQFRNSLQQNLVEFLGGAVLPKLEGFFDFAKNHSGLLGGMAAGVLALGAAFSVAAIGVWAMNSAMLANPMFWIIAGVAVAVVGLVLLVVTYWDQIKSATLAAWSWVVAKLVWAKDMMVAAFLNFTLIGLIIKHWAAIKSATVGAWNATVAWVKGIPGKLYQAFLNWTLLGLVIKHWAKIKTATVSKAMEMVAWVRGLPGRISSGIGSLGSLLTQKGRNVVQGLWNGISAMGGWIRSKIMGWAKSVIPGPIAKALGIASPSKVTKAQGRWIARGLADGLTGSTKQVKAAATKLADIVRDSMKPGRSRTRALAVISSGQKKLLKLASQDEKVATRLKAAQKMVADQIKARDKLAADVTAGVLGDADITKQTGAEGGGNAESILDQLRQDTAAAQRFAANLAALRKKGVRSDLIAQIAQAGVSGGSSAAAALANADKGQIKQINSQQAALVKAAGQAGTTAGNAMYGAGIQAAQGLVRGLQAQQRAIEKQMLKIAKSMSASIRRALGIRSPSRVMALVGAYTARGLVKGMEGERAAVNATMASLVDTPTAGQAAVAASAAARKSQANASVIELRSDGGAASKLVLALLRDAVKPTGGNVQVAVSGR